MKKPLILIAAVFLMLLPMLAMAQISGPFGGAVPASDVSKSQFLDYLFGPLTGGGSSPLSALMEVFNGCVLLLGGILVGYTLIAGTMQTAHDGEMLGKRWSSMWVPIRTALGAASILPVFNGFCVIQAVVIWLAVQGIGMANLMWNAYLDGDPIEDAFYVPPNGARQIRAVLDDMLMSNVCVASFQKTQSSIGSIGAAVGLNPVEIRAQAVPATWTGVTGYVYGGTLPGTQTLCGSAVMSVALAAGSAGSDNGVPFAGLSDLPARMQPTHQAQFSAAQASLAALATQIADGNATAAQISSTMTSLTNNYSEALQAQAKALYEAEKETIKAQLHAQMKRDGWALAGAYYMYIIRAQDQVTRAITQTPATATGEAWSSGESSTGFLTDAATGGGVLSAAGRRIKDEWVNSGERGEILENARALIKEASHTSSTGLQSVGMDASSGSWVVKIVGWFMNDDFMRGEFGQVNQNPIVMIKNIGDNMTATAWAGFTVGSLVLVATGSVAIGSGVVLTPMLYALFGMLVVPGATLSTYVPMIPYILWVGVLIGWLILVVEAVYAAPIWAVAHLAPDGDGVVGRGGQGYMLVLSLTLRPPLMILGLVSSIILIKPIGYFINTTFLGAFALAVDPGPFALTSAIAGCIIYTVLMISVIHRVFTLIHVVPDRILRWIGGGGNELGGEAQATEGMTAGKAVAAVGATQQIGNLTQGAIQGSRDHAMREGQKRQTSAIQAEEGRSRQAQIEGNRDDVAYRAEQSANTSIAKATAAGGNNAPLNNDAAMKSESARDARLQQASESANYAMSSSDEGTPAHDSAKAFMGELQAARTEQAQSPNGNAMQQFLDRQAMTARQEGHEAQTWTRGAASASASERDRRQWSSPDPLKSSGGGGGAAPSQQPGAPEGDD